jgi:hypothetical protein
MHFPSPKICSGLWLTWYIDLPNILRKSIKYSITRGGGKGRELNKDDAKNNCLHHANEPEAYRPEELLNLEDLERDRMHD